MRRTIGRLTARQVSTAKPRAGRDARLLADGGNLYLQLTTGPDNHVRRSWLFRYEINGRRREMGLGALSSRTLNEAREKAKALRLLLADGIDPLDDRRRIDEARAVEAAKNKTFGAVATAYFDAHGDDWKNSKHAAQWAASLTRDSKAICDLPVAAIGTEHVLDVLKPIWRTKPESASRTRGRIERVLAYAIAAGYRRREDGNPATWSGHLQELLGAKSKAAKAKRERTGKTGHHAALPYQELPEFMARLRALDSLSARALEFAILTAARTGEVIGATRGEIDLDAKTWIVPAGRMKRGKEHRVPLGARAVEILRERKGERPFPLSAMGMLQCCRGLRAGITVHGFRSAFRDWAGDCTRFDREAVEFTLAHGITDRTEAAYRRADALEKRRRLLKAWEEFLAKPVPQGATVTSLRRTANA
jgi:integrase